MSVMTVMTKSLTELVAAERESRDKGLPAGWPSDPASRVMRLWAHLLGGGDPRTPPADWRPTYPLDDPSNEPDLWISDQDEPTIWCKLDRHGFVAPGGYEMDAELDPELSGPRNFACAWCGKEHVDEMDVYTFMLPEEW